MACLLTLKAEIKTLKNTFGPNHPCFQILNATVDEITCRFIGKNGKKYQIFANITVSGLF
jgi:ubiquitin-conjugating enzyme E2 Q